MHQPGGLPNDMLCALKALAIHIATGIRQKDQVTIGGRCVRLNGGRIDIMAATVSQRIIVMSPLIQCHRRAGRQAQDQYQ